MDFLAFDIEAANGYKPYSICSIGVILADENFNVKYRENIWINPKTKYNLNGTRKNIGIDLHLDKNLIDSSPDFSQVYDKVKSLLTGNVQVLGHAVESDVIMLNAACKHYRLPSINFKFICSQLLFRLYRGEKEVRALKKIADELSIEFNEHNSEEDAYMSMMTLKYLVNDSKLTVDELMDKYSVRMGENRDFEMTRTVSLEGQVNKKKVRKVAESKIYDYIKKTRFPKVSSKFKGKSFALARAIELGDFDVVRPVLNTIYSNGGSYNGKLTACQYYVKGYTRSRRRVLEMDEPREAMVDEMVAKGKIEIISINDLFYMAEGEKAEAEKND